MEMFYGIHGIIETPSQEKQSVPADNVSEQYIQHDGSATRIAGEHNSADIEESEHNGDQKQENDSSPDVLSENLEQMLEKSAEIEHNADQNPTELQRFVDEPPSEPDHTDSDKTNNADPVNLDQHDSDCDEKTQENNNSNGLQNTIADSVETSMVSKEEIQDAGKEETKDPDTYAEQNNAPSSDDMGLDEEDTLYGKQHEQENTVYNGNVIESNEGQDEPVDSGEMLEKVVSFDLEVEKGYEPAEPSLLWKIIKTMCLVCVWICLGLCGEITGPTLLDLKLRTHSNYESVSSGVSGRSAGFFVGSALGGVLVDRFGLFCDVMVALGLDGEAMATVAVPWMPTTNLIFVMTMLQGTMEGVINIAGQKLILNMWKEKAAAPLHLLHGGFGIGSFVIPLVANPFLAVTEKISENTSFIDNVTLMPGVTTTPRPTTTTEVVIEESRMEYAYIIAAAVAVCVSLVFYAYHVKGRQDRILQRQHAGNDKADTRTISFREMFNPATCAGGDLLHGVLIFGLTFLFFVQAVGGERVGGKFIRTYAIKHLDFSDDDGTYINTVFWIAFAVGRVLGLLTARFIPIRLLIMLETGGCLLISVFLVIFADDDSTSLWALMPIIGFYIAPLFPSGIGWANYHIEMTGVAITFFMLGGSVGGIIYMRLTGYLFDHYGYETFLYMLLGFAIAAFSIATLMNIVGIRHGSRFDQERLEPGVVASVKDEEVEIKYENKGYNSE